MSLEATIFQTLRGLVADRVYPDEAPEDVQALPRVTYQQVGGTSQNYLQSAPVGKRNARVQFNVWGKTRLQVAALTRQIADTLKSEPALYTTLLSEAVAINEPELGLRGARFDCSFWY